MRLANEVARVRQFRESLRALSDEERAALVRDLGDDFADAWEILARDEQLPPAGDWWCWVLGAARGFGKTRALSGTIHMAVRAGYRRMHLVCPSYRDVIDTMVDGPSGILATAPPGERPRWIASRHRVEWDTGATVTCFSAENYEALRGPQCQLAFVDELAKMPEAEDVFGGIMYGLRLGPDKPRLIVATTPRPTQFYKGLVKMPGVVLTSGSTFENARNLPPEFLAQISSLYDGTRQGRQELHGELLMDIPGQMFMDSWIIRREINDDEVEMVSIGVDPAGGSYDETGIVAAARLADGTLAVLGDHSLKASPAEWGETVVRVFDDYDGDDVSIEKNYGGPMCTAVVKAAAERLHAQGRRESPTIRLREVVATRGKAIRAEPIAALYERGRVLHAPGLHKLESELLSFSRDFDNKAASPNRMDAAIWGLERLRQVRHVTIV
jgi:phage terminase large subunit-like protein